MSRTLSEITLNIRTAVWIGRKLARVVRSDLRRQVALVHRRVR